MIIGSVESDEPAGGLHPRLSTDIFRPAKAVLREIKIPSAASKSLFYLLSLLLFRFRLLVARSLSVIAAILDCASQTVILAPAMIAIFAAKFLLLQQ